MPNDKDKTTGLQDHGTTKPVGVQASAWPPYPIPAWLQAEVAAYDLEISPPPRSILDIGANIGAYSLRCAAKWPEARITAFETVNNTYADLRRHTKHNPRISALNQAVRSFTGYSPIFLGDHSVISSFHQRGRQKTETETVFCSEAASLESHELVKIDTEGCEVEILSGLNLDRTRALVVEYHSNTDCLAIKANLSSRGFTLLSEVPGSADHGILKFAKDPGVNVPSSSSSSSSASASAPVPDDGGHPTSAKATAGGQSAATQTAPTSAPCPPTSARKVYLAVAGHYGFNDLLFVQSLLTLGIKPSVSCHFGWSCDPSVERARNILTANFLESECSHILFVDTDIGFTRQDVARISSHAELVVGGMYPLKTDAPDVAWCGNGLQAGEAPIREDGLSQVKYIGTGFLCLRREILELLAKHPDVKPYRQDFPPHRRETAYWYQRVAQDRFLTEDWNFCQMCLELGIPIWGDSQVVLRHAGRAVWPLNIQRGNPFVGVQASACSPAPEQPKG